MAETPPTGAGAGAVPLRDALARPLHDLRISVTDRCNFRCRYCMPREQFGGHRFLPTEHQLDFAELERLGRLFVGLGARKLRLTGGEPLLRPRLAELVARLAALPGVEDIALTTNGVLLAAHAAELRAAGLGRITVSLNSLDPEIFARMSGGGRLAEVLAGISAARAAGLAPLKVNAVVQRGVNDGTILELVEHFRGTGIVLRFIEYMDVGNCHGWDPALVVPSAELIARIGARWSLEPRAKAAPGEVASRYAFADGAGEIGFISSVTRPFCGDCARARLSSEGTLYTCLFAGRGTSLRDPLRAGADDAALTALIRGVWAGRADRYSEERAALVRAPTRGPKVEMHVVGG
ncbi:MAG TPA: GTP 3',8-cyclase MoaA [Polyangia bacterium]|jgi:cyclic pyranopterin phosphate synthase